MNARFQFVTLVLWFVALLASAQTKAPEDFTIIEEQPEGELRVYNRTGFTVREHEEGEENGEDDYRRWVTKGGVQDGIINIVFGAEHSVYFQYIVSESYYEGWVRGTLSADGKRITLPMGQYTAYTWSFDMGTQVWLMKYVPEEDTYIIDESVSEVIFDVSPDGVITMLGTDENHIISVVNRAFGDTFSYLDWEWHGMGDYQSVYTPMNSHFQTPPEDLETQTLIATSGYHDGVGWDVYNTTVRMGFDGDDVWLQGLCGLMSSAWVRGTRSGDVITIPSGQELGAYYGAMLYLVSAVPDENAEPIVGDSFSFTYDAERDAWVSYDDIMANSSKSVIQYVNYYMGMTLSTHPDRVADVPEGLNLVEYTMTYQEPNNQGRLVSQTHTLKGTERDGVVYLQGFTPYQPDGFIVGTIGSDGQVVFKSPQYLGTFDDEESGFKYPIFFQAFDGYTGELKPQVTFTRDATTHVLSDPSCAIGIGINKTGLLCQQYLYNVELTPVVVEGPVNIGWCDDELATTLQPIGIDASGTSRISAAIQLPRTKLKHYEGMTITKLRFAVKPGFEKMSVWIRSQLDASSIVVQSVSDVVDGWNEVMLNTPLVIDGSDLYIGYTGTQPEGFKGILAYGDGDEYSSWLALDNQWADYHEDGLGKLYIQAVAEGVMQQRDATVISLTTDKMAYAPTETLIVSGELENLGATDLQGYTLNFNIDGSQVATQTSNQLLRPDEVTTFSRELPLSFVKEGRHEVSVTISNSPLPSAGQGATFYVYKSSYPRTLLLEHFTSLPCVNCPRDDAKLEEVVAGRSDVAWVSHHVGYADDEFTLEIERTLTRFGVDGNPYVMLDRTAFNEGEPPAFVISSFDASMVNTIFDYAATMPALVELKATTMTNDNELTITVSGEGKSFLTDLYPRAMLNVYLVEDQVTAEGTQAGDANKKQHDNIMRQMVTPVRGTLPTWEVSADGLPTFSTQLTTTLDPSWNQQQLRVVAFLTAQAPTGSGWPTGEVLNSVQTPVAASTAVTSVALATQQTGQWYTIDGRRVSSPLQKGLYIYNGKKIIK